MPCIHETVWDLCHSSSLRHFWKTYLYEYDTCKYIIAYNKAFIDISLWKAARPCFSCLCLLNESMDRFCTWYSDYVVVPVLGISRLASPNAFVMNTSSSAIILLLNSILGRISPSSQIVSMHLNMIRASKSAVMILKPFCSPRLSCTAPKTWNSKNIFE